MGARVGNKKIAADPHAICSARTRATISIEKWPKEAPTLGIRIHATEFYPGKMPNHE